jgi:hypothetical protein
MIERESHVPARVAILEAADEDLIESCAGNNTQLAQSRHSPREFPIGDSRAHAALDDRRMRGHTFFYYYRA